MISNNFFRKTYQYLKSSNGSYVKGNWVPGSTTPTNTIASAQPITGNELETLNIGQRQLGKIKIYTNDDYQVAEYDSNNSITVNGDVFIYDNRKWEIIAQLPYKSDIISHNKYIAEYRGKYTL